MKKFFSSKKNRTITIIVAIVIAILVVLGVLWKQGILFSGAQDEEVYVEKVSSLVSHGYGVTNQYMGVVESMETKEITADTSKTIKEVYVSVGSEVNVGDKLFAYDTKEIDDQIATLQIDIDSANGQIENYNRQINDLIAERDKAKDAQKFEYTTEIQSIQTEIQEVQNGKSGTQREIAQLEASKGEAVVTSEISGVVKSLQDPTSMDMEMGAFMVISTKDSYRIKGSINEQNVATITEGAAVIIRSRVDDTKWHGTIDKVDTENPISNAMSDEYYEEGGSSNAQSTKYPFYVALDDGEEGLLMGQHVYVELDYGQDEEKEGLWLNSGYVVVNEDQKTGYIWAANKSNRLEKRDVKIGDYDEETDEYLITEGLELKDRIAFIMDELKAGTKVVDMDMEEAVDGEDGMDDVGDADFSDEGMGESGADMNPAREDLVYKDMEDGE